MSIQRNMYFDRIVEKAVKGTKKRDEPFTVVAIKSNKVVDQFAGAEHDELSEVIEYMKKNNPGAKISVERKKGGVVHTENVEEGRDEEYEKFFKAALKKFGADSPADFKDEKKKKEFFDYVDKNYKAKDEAVSVKDSVDYDEANGIIEGYLNKDK
jgi:hypothetical protein